MSFNVANRRSFSSSSENGKMNCTPEEHPSLSAQNIVLPLSPFLFRSQLSHSLQIRLENTSNSSSRSSPLLFSTDGHPLQAGSLPALQPPSPPENGNAVCGRQMISVDIRHISADRPPQPAAGPRMPSSVGWQTPRQSPIP